MSRGRRDLIESWHQRARAYRDLTDAYPIFAGLADRLVEALELGSAERGLTQSRSDASIVDLGAGSGLLSERVLAARPRARLLLLEPAEAALAGARDGLGDGRHRFYEACAEELATWVELAAAVLSNLAMHLVDEASVLTQVGRVLSPGGVFAFNLWWYADAETAGRPHPCRWREAVVAALENLGVPDYVVPASPQPRVRDPELLVRQAESAGLRRVLRQIDIDRLDARFFIDFAAMDSKFLADLPVDLRTAAIQEARANLCHEVEVATVRQVFVAVR